MRVETNNTEYPQLNTLSCNKLLSLSKLHHHSSSTSLSYAVSFLNYMYKMFTLSFDSNITESKVSGTDNKVSACVNILVSKLQLQTKFIQIQPTKSNTQQFYPHMQLT